MALSFRFGTVGSPMGTPKPGGSVTAIKYLRSIELDALELGWVQSVRVSEATCAEIRATSLAENVAVSVHAPYYINLNATEEEWPKSRKRLMDASRLGCLAGATDIIFHPGSYFGNQPGDVLKIAIPRLKECMDELRSDGIGCTLRPETMGKSAMLGSFEDTIEMAAAIEGVNPCFDFAHLHARPGDGSINSEEEWVERLNIIKNRLGQQYLESMHIHLSGIEYGPKGEKFHLPLLESDFDLSGLFKALAKVGAKGRILCESPIMEEDALRMKNAWIELTGEFS
ncbi:MAG TPA: TIM barrel protein [Anaerolineales bacterium]|nr:TIM barrel protein [Anaerolineales bacterium]